MSTSTISVPWRKTAYEIESPIEPKKTRYYFRLESESSAASTDDTESVYSIQDKETDVVRDTSDTGSKSSECELDIEYEIDSLSSDDDRELIVFDSSGESEDMIYAAAVIADSSLETFITDAEDSDNSQGELSTGLTDFWICIQCKCQNDNPQFQFCDKCFKDRKAIFPPRPRRRKKADRCKEQSHSPVKLDALKSCLRGLSSQDSGIGSSQEFSSLCLDQIVVPNSEIPSTSVATEEVKNRKRQFSESSLSDGYEEKKPPKLAKMTVKDENTESSQEKKNEEDESKKKDAEKCENKSDVVDCAENLPARTKDGEEECIMCNMKPKDSVFLHGRIAHMCCCYGCAMRAWKTSKRCPLCRRKVSNVVRVFKI